MFEAIAIRSLTVRPDGFKKYVIFYAQQHTFRHEYCNIDMLESHTFLYVSKYDVEMNIFIEMKIYSCIKKWSDMNIFSFNFFYCD